MSRNASSKGPGRADRQGMSLIEIIKLFPDDAAAEAWFVKTRCPDGVTRPHCPSDNVLHVRSRKPQPYRCRACRKHFSVRTGTLMHGSNFGLQTWVLVFFLVATGINGTASMKLHRDLGVTQETAWHLARRIRETWRDNARSSQVRLKPTRVLSAARTRTSMRTSAAARAAAKSARLRWPA